MNHAKDTEVGAVDISDIQPSQGDYVCPCCSVFRPPLSHHDCESIRTDASTGVEVQCPSCGYKLNPITDQTKHASKLIPKITEEMIADEEDDDSIFETVEDSSRIEDNEETDYFAEDDK